MIDNTNSNTIDINSLSQRMKTAIVAASIANELEIKELSSDIDSSVKLEILIARNNGMQLISVLTTDIFGSESFTLESAGSHGDTMLESLFNEVGIVDVGKIKLTSHLTMLDISWDSDIESTECSHGNTYWGDWYDIKFIRPLDNESFTKLEDKAKAVYAAELELWNATKDIIALTSIANKE